MEYIPSEILDVSFVLITCHACGMKDNVVKNAAMTPIIASPPIDIIARLRIFRNDYTLLQLDYNG